MFDIALSNDDDDLARQNAMDLLSDAGFSFFGFATGHWFFFHKSYHIISDSPIEAMNCLF